MDLALTDADLAFQAEVREFIDTYWPEDVRRARATSSRFEESRGHSPEVRRWIDALNERGWAVPNWPQQWGGTDWNPTQKYIWDKETAKAECPQLSAFGARMLAPVLYTWGTEAQQNEFLPKIREERMIWCQGYSEPGAGSDLASLKTFAESDGDDYVINGTKIWTTYAHHANRMFLLVRTRRDGKPQAGITFLLLDMNTPGITVEPIVGLDEVPEQCQVFFDNVRVPKRNRVGEENDGWTVAKYLLTFERGGQDYAPALGVQLQRLKQIAARQTTAGGGSLREDPVWAHKVAACESEALALSFTEKRIKSALSAGKDPGALSSMTKILGTELQQRVTELGIETLGSQALVWQPQALVPGGDEAPLGPEYALTAMASYLNARACSIYGGSNEVQRGIIAKAVLGL